MMPLDATTLQRLKDNSVEGRASYYLVKMQINGEWVYITDADVPIDYAGATYQPGYIDDESIDDIETTSEPKTNDIGIEIDANENSFVPLFLGNNWMNGPVTIYEQHYDSQGLILTKNVFEGLIDSRDIDPEKKKILVNISSVWADFEKEAGIRTNTKSQQRHYAGDTAFDHVARAKRKIYWGKEAPASSRAGTNTRPDNNRFPPPEQP